MQNALPPLQPGQRIIVRHHSNGDTEYICRQDEELFTARGCGNTLLWVAVAVLLYLVFFADLSKSPREQTKEVQENIELEQENIELEIADY